MTAFLAGGYSLNFPLYHLWLMVAAISWLTTTQTQTGIKWKYVKLEMRRNSVRMSHLGEQSGERGPVS